MNRLVPSKSKLFSSISPHKTLKTCGPLAYQAVISEIKAYFRNRDIPLNFVHSCTTQENLEVFLQRRLYPGLQREEGESR